MPTSSLILIAALTPSAGIVGAIFFPRLQKSALPWSNLRMLVLLVVLATLVPLWGLVALRQAWQIYLLAIVFGGTLAVLLTLSARADSFHTQLYTVLFKPVRAPSPLAPLAPLTLLNRRRSHMLRRARPRLAIGALVRPLLHHRQE